MSKIIDVIKKFFSREENKGMPCKNTVWGGIIKTIRRNEKVPVFITKIVTEELDKNFSYYSDLGILDRLALKRAEKNGCKYYIDTNTCCCKKDQLMDYCYKRYISDKAYFRLDIPSDDFIKIEKEHKHALLLYNSCDPETFNILNYTAKIESRASNFTKTTYYTVKNKKLVERDSATVIDIKESIKKYNEIEEKTFDDFVHARYLMTIKTRDHTNFIKLGKKRDYVLESKKWFVAKDILDPKNSDYKTYDDLKTVEYLFMSKIIDAIKKFFSGEKNKETPSLKNPEESLKTTQPEDSKTISTFTPQDGKTMPVVVSRILSLEDKSNDLSCFTYSTISARLALQRAKKNGFKYYIDTSDRYFVDGLPMGYNHESNTDKNGKQIFSIVHADSRDFEKIEKEHGHALMLYNSYDPETFNILDYTAKIKHCNYGLPKTTYYTVKNKKLVERKHVTVIDIEESLLKYKKMEKKTFIDLLVYDNLVNIETFNHANFIKVESDKDVVIKLADTWLVVKDSLKKDLKYKSFDDLT